MKKFNEMYKRIILEMAGTFKEEPILANEIIKYENEKLISNEELKLLIKNDENLNNGMIKDEKINLRILKFDSLKDEEKLKNSLIKFYSKTNNFDNRLIKIIEKFKTSKALLIPFDENKKEAALLLNTNPFKKFKIEDIYHEITHLLQPFEEKHKLHLNKLSNNDINILKNKNILINEMPNEIIEYIFDDNEFIPHINDLCFALKCIKNNKYKNLSNENFLNKLFKILKSNDPFKEEISIDILQYLEDYIPLILFLSSYHLNNNFNKVKEIIENDFKN